VLTAIRLEAMYLLINEIPAAMECFAQKFGDVVATPAS